LGLVAYIYSKTYIPTQKTFEGLNHLKISRYNSLLMFVNKLGLYRSISYLCIILIERGWQ